MNIKSPIVFLTIFFGLFYVAKAQFALQVGDQFLPITNNDIISKQLLLKADTVRVMYLAPGTQSPSEMHNVMIVTQPQGGDAAAFMHPTGILGGEARNKIATIDAGRIGIGQYTGPRYTIKGAFIWLNLGP